METQRSNNPQYIRLARKRTDGRYCLERGIFMSAGGLEDTNGTTYADAARMRAALRWINEYLPYPRKMNSVHAIFWFKEHVAYNEPELWRKIVELKELLSRYDYAIELRRTQRPGYIKYEDYYQIAAVPLRDTFDGLRQGNA